MKRQSPLVCLVTCYYDTNYVRTTTLRESARHGSYDYVHVANKKRGIGQYFEVLFGLIKVRLTRNPDVYFLTFRGYEILPIIRLITLGKPLVYDEFINPIELVVHEQKIIKSPMLISVISWGYRLCLKTVQHITTDTRSHAEYSAEMMNIPIDKYTVLPLGTDEETFDFAKHSGIEPDSDKFQVFYYGSMLPLHGVDVVLKAMELLKDYAGIELLMVGGKDRAKQAIEEATNLGARVKHQAWIDYDKLPVAMSKASLCLGGPFGATTQSRYVITGKTYQQLSLSCPTVIGLNKESDVFKDKFNSLIVEQDSPAKLAEAILWAYKNRDQLEEIGRNGRKLYKEKFSMDVLSQKTDDLFAKLFKNS